MIISWQYTLLFNNLSLVFVLILFYLKKIMEYITMKLIVHIPIAYREHQHFPPETCITWETNRIHHEYPMACGIWKSHQRGKYFCQGRGLTSPWSKYSLSRVRFPYPKWINSGQIIFSLYFSKNMKLMCFHKKFKSISMTS